MYCEVFFISYITLGIEIRIAEQLDGVTVSVIYKYQACMSSCREY